MELALICCRLLVAAAIVASNLFLAPIDRAGTPAEAINGAARATLAAMTEARIGPDQLNDTNSGGADCSRACLSDCANSVGSGCCTPSLLVDHLPFINPIATAIGKFDAADSAIKGTDPETPQEPPQAIA